MSLFLALVGLALLIVLHELGHFAAAKAVGMRVERACLFFPPLVFKVRRGETEYGIGAIPLGGYVKITGMNPQEIDGLEPEVAARAYYNQAVWKRVFVIVAGPVVNLVIAFVIFWFLLFSGSLGAEITLSNVGPPVANVVSSPTVEQLEKGAPATGVLKLGDKILAVDGHGGSVGQITAAIGRDSCAGTPTPGCTARAPLALTVLRAGRRVSLSVRPRYDATAQRMRVGFAFGAVYRARSYGPLAAATTAVSEMWHITEQTVVNIGRAFTDSKVRHQLSGIVGVTQTAQQAVASGPEYGFVVLGFISLSLAVLNLFPFLPLDGGHILWSVAEKVRRRRISPVAMIRFSAVPALLLGFLVLTALSNNISSLAGSGPS